MEMVSHTRHGCECRARCDATDATQNHRLMNLKSGVDALLICSRNRPSQVENRLQELQQFRCLPSVMLIVDSSTNDETRKIVSKKSRFFPIRLLYLHAPPGLPRQRNCGINLLRGEYPDLQFIHFLDDDVVVKHDYFDVVSRIFVEFPNVIAVGGHDEEIQNTIHNGLIRRTLGIGSKLTGVILPSGIAIPPVPTTAAYSCEWLVGGMQSVRAHIFDLISFDSKLRMYGEDLDFYLRASTYGEIVCSSQLPIKHLNDPSNRDSQRNIQLFHNGVRWHFAKKYPDRVVRWKVLLAAVALGLGEIVKFLKTRRIRHFEAAIGNLEFLFCLAVRKSTLQVVVDDR